MKEERDKTQNDKKMKEGRDGEKKKAKKEKERKNKGHESSNESFDCVVVPCRFRFKDFLESIKVIYGETGNNLVNTLLRFLRFL